jgi:hypothetical protein
MNMELNNNEKKNCRKTRKDGVSCGQSNHRRKDSKGDEYQNLGRTHGSLAATRRSIAGKEEGITLVVVTQSTD